MDCKLNKNLLYSYADETIDPLEKIFVEEHLKYCTSCKKDLEVIRLIDENLNSLEDDFIFPERLSLISQLVVENCLAEIDGEDLKTKVENFYKSYKELNSTIKHSQNQYKQNPFNKFITKSVNKSIDYMKEPVKKYVKRKVNKIGFFNLFKVG